ncbi:hypothetical protein BKA64DRAFT_334164 [Cadophora sp. MPI-SDFR-AT-0126]|nr:hypothetical protein BKA64DRAFT_334164 [Leotiomycetes sp. MPI-SDFR-AT-0126]
MPKHVPLKESLHHNLLDLDSVLTVADRINSVVPGFRTSATFFTFLRSNLVLPASTLNSTTSTPLLDASSSQTLPPLLTTSSLATMSSLDSSDLPAPSHPTSSPSSPTSNPLDGIPPLTTTLLTTSDSKIAALKLIADSIAQQRQYAARAIIFHPLTIALYVLLLATISQFLYKSRSDLGILFTTAAGVTMACLVAVRGATGGYLVLAEGIGWGFVRSEDGSGSGEEDLMIGSWFGDELIGALVLRLERNGGNGGGGANGKRKGKGGGKSGGNGVVRAWTVRNKYRGKGVGTELLEEAVRITREKLGNSSGVGFAAEHANSKMILPGIFNSGFKKREGMAGRMLAGVVENANGTKKKR